MELRIVKRAEQGPFTIKKQFALALHGVEKIIPYADCKYGVCAGDCIDTLAAAIPKRLASGSNSFLWGEHSKAVR